MGSETLWIINSITGAALFWNLLNSCFVISFLSVFMFTIMPDLILIDYASGMLYVIVF